MLKIVFLICLITYVSPACQDISPKIFSDCTENSDPLNYCCYAYSPIGKKCLLRSRADWKVTKKITLLADNTEYTLDCGIASTFNFNSNDVTNAMGIPAGLTDLNADNKNLPAVGASCGRKGNNLDFTECNDASLPFNNCCLYEFGSNAMCFYLGKTYNGNMTYGNIKVACSGKWINVYIMTILSILLIFI